MSGIIKKIGKVFKKVVKVVKKFALPVLAIGAVALTGGAALGLLPAIGGAGGLGASLGLSSTLTGILSSAATGATIGAAGSLVTGGNIIDGATRGLVGGAVTGGIGAAFNGGAQAATTAAGSTAPTAAGAAPSLSNPASFLGSGGGSASGVISNGADSMFRSAAGIGAARAPAFAFTPSAAAAGSLAPGAVASAAPAAGAAARGGFGGWLERNPLLAGSLVQGIGSGLSAAAAARDERRQREEERASYEGVEGALYSYNGQGGGTYQDAGERFTAPIYGRVEYDRATGRIVARG